MIRSAVKNGIRFGFVGCDSHYCEQPDFLDALNEDGIIYVAEIPCNTRVWLEFPSFAVPERTSKRGRTPTIPHPFPQSQEVRKIAEDLPFEQWKTITVRDCEKGPLTWQLAAVLVFVSRNGLPDRKECLIIRKSLHGNDIKYAFSNADRMSCRYWVERALQNGKSHAKLDEYMVRGWRGWHHHMTMTLQVTLKERAPRLTLADAREILEIVLPKKQFTLESAVEYLRLKHQQRDAAKRLHPKKSLQKK